MVNHNAWCCQNGEREQFPFKKKGRSQISSSLYSVRDKLLGEHTQGAHSAEGYGEDDGHAMF